MTLAITHSTVVVVADDGTSPVGTDEWNAAHTLTGVSSPTQGGTGTGTAFTAGSVVFAGASGVYSQDNADFFWDDTNRALFIGGAVPGAYYAYNTFTSGTNFERAIFSWNATSNTLVIGTEKGSGGGTARDVQFRVGGTDVAYFLAVSAGSAFAGDLLWTTDNNNNIGSVAAHRPADIYVANGVHVGGSGSGNSIIDASGRFTSNGSIAGNQSYFNLNNNGANYGSVGNVTTNIWYLGSSATGAAMSTIALQWDVTNNVTVFGGTTLAAGTTTLAPLTFPSGTNLTTAVAGVVEYDGASFFASPAASSRAVVLADYFIRQHATYTLSNSASVQKLFNGSTNGQVTLPAGTYEFECVASLSSLSATSGNAAFSIANGTGTATNFLFSWSAIDAVSAAIGAWSSGMAVTSATPAAMATATVATTLQFIVRGTFEVSSAGTIIPSIQLANAAAGVVAIGSYFSCHRLGAATVTATGNWS